MVSVTKAQISKMSLIQLLSIPEADFEEESFPFDEWRDAIMGQMPFYLLKEAVEDIEVLKEDVRKLKKHFPEHQHIGNKVHIPLE